MMIDGKSCAIIIGMGLAGLTVVVLAFLQLVDMFR